MLPNSDACRAQSQSAIQCRDGLSIGPLKCLLALCCIFTIYGCSSMAASRSARIVSDNGEFSIASILRARGIPPEDLDDGSIRIQNTPETRRALLVGLSVTRTRLDVIANNIVNADVTRRSDGNPGPYRRQRVTLNASGSLRSIDEDSQAIDREYWRYEPSHPDADSEGYVIYPDVDISAEMINMIDASREYDITVELLRRFNPDLVLSSRSTKEGVASVQSMITATPEWQ